MHAIRLAHQTTHRIVALALAALFTLATAGGIDHLSFTDVQPQLQAQTAAAAHS